MNTRARLRRRAGFQIEQLGQDLLLYHPQSEKIFALNHTAAMLWHLCDGERTLAEILTLLCEAYPEARSVIPAQVAAALDQMLEHGALVEGRAPGEA